MQSRDVDVSDVIAKIYIKVQNGFARTRGGSDDGSDIKRRCNFRWLHQYFWVMAFFYIAKMLCSHYIQIHLAMNYTLCT